MERNSERQTSTVKSLDIDRRGTSPPLPSSRVCNLVSLELAISIPPTVYPGLWWVDPVPGWRQLEPMWANVRYDKRPGDWRDAATGRVMLYRKLENLTRRK